MNKHFIYKNKNKFEAPGTDNIIYPPEKWLLGRGQCLFISALFIGLTMYYSSAHSAEPPGATPGGAQPELQEPPTLPPAAPERPFIEQEEEQPPPSDEGAMAVVPAFRVQGVVERPKQDIRLEDIQRLVDEIHRVRGGKFTRSQLHDVATQVTRYYRRRGYIFTRAYLERDKAQAEVVVNIVEPTLGQVVAQDNQLYRSAQLLKPFNNLQGDPVYINSIEQTLLQLNDYPGVSLYGLFTKGAQPNTTDLFIKVTEEYRYNFDILLDNYGTEYTGEYRARLRYAVNNLFHRADRVFGDVLQTLNPENGTFGAIAYDSLVYSPNYRAGVGYSRNKFDVGRELASFGITGSTDIGNVYLHYTLLRSRTENRYVWIDLSRKRSLVKTPGLPDREDNLSVLSAAYQFDVVDSLFGKTRSANNQAYISYIHGFPDLLGAMDKNGNGVSTRVGGSGQFAGGEFDKLFFRYIRYQYDPTLKYFLFRLEGQYSNDLLTSLEQYSLGGANNVRAYSTSEYLRDKALFASVEWITNVPGLKNIDAFAGQKWAELLRLSLFFDYAKGKLNDSFISDDESVDIMGLGIGLQLVQEHRLRIRADIATAVGEPPEPSNDRDPQYWLNLSYYLR